MKLIFFLNHECYIQISLIIVTLERYNFDCTRKKLSDK